MSLPDRQQQVLDQIEQALQSADPALKSMYAMFGRLTSPEAMPTIEAMTAGEGAAADTAGAGEVGAATGTAGRAAGTGAAGQAGTAGKAGTARGAAAGGAAVGLVGPIPSQAGVASKTGSRKAVRRAVVISVIVLGMLGLMIFNVVTTGSQCPGLSSDQVVASAAVRYAACNHSTDAWSKGAR